mgnify:CR=1 FL=1
MRPATVALAMTLLGAGLASGQSLAQPAQERVLASWTGSGAQRPRPFKADGPWELQWEADGFFQAWLIQPNGQAGVVVANQMQAGPGSFYSTQTGEITIQFNAMQRWRAKVVAVR